MKASRKTDSLPSFDVRILGRQGLVKAGVRSIIQVRRGRTNSPFEIEAYGDTVYLRPVRSTTTSGFETTGSYARLTFTACRYGGQRPWWLCPGCSRRVAILYGEDKVLCRTCQGLSYKSQAESAGRRAVRRANRLRRALGWPPGIATGIGDRPRGMHIKTYRRLLDAYLSASSEGFDYLGRSLPTEPIDHRLSSLNARAA